MWALHRLCLSFLGMLCPSPTDCSPRVPALLTWRSVTALGGLATTQTAGPTPESQIE